MSEATTRRIIRLNAWARLPPLSWRGLLARGNVELRRDRR